ncbi:MAG: hypothetical protein GF317_00860 [Candidatus Lokiarchaeota archaeon]|nr:hypothetical protein [Candidatus Lokiarchaeota archaeon]MBD3198511.1 hypothetical protein [Candidatus Lokiarchaeota archaeon]
MKYNKLGSTDIDVSRIGLGGEWLNGKSQEEVKAIIETAIEGGINFFDFLFNHTDYVTKIGKAINEFRDRMIIQTHIGTTEKEGKANRDRNMKRNKKFFHNTLNHYKTEYVDIINIQFVKEKEFQDVKGDNGLLGLANQLKNEGKARFIGLSTHNASIAINAIKEELVDTIMFPINMINHNLEHRAELLSLIVNSGIGLIGIKPFAGGKLLQNNRTVYIAKYQTGGISERKKIPKLINLHQCVKYCLDQKGISTIIPGVHKEEELAAILQYYKISRNNKDYKTILPELLS